MVPSYPERRTVTETAPLMKVTPQRDGKFVLEPLTPQEDLENPAFPAAQERGKERSRLFDPSQI